MKVYEVTIHGTRTPARIEAYRTYMTAMLQAEAAAGVSAPSRAWTTEEAVRALVEQAAMLWERELRHFTNLPDADLNTVVRAAIDLQAAVRRQLKEEA